jgi:uncharacterized protein (TIGR03067 family)
MILDGTWTAVVAELGGQHIDDEFISVITLTIAKDTCDVHIGGYRYAGTLKFIPHVVPMAFDITVTEGEHKGKVIKAIYKTAGGFLMVCYNTVTADRPKTFVSNPENQYYLVRYKRPE